MKKTLLILACAVTLKAAANIPADTTVKILPAATDSVKSQRIKSTSFILPAAMVSYGALSFAVKPVRDLDYDVRNEVAQTAPNFHTNAETYFLFTPIIMVYGLNFAGVKGRNNFTDRTAILALSAGFGGILDFSIKHLSHRQDPGHASYTSFPSGHTLAAFAGAEFLSQEYGGKSPLYTIIGYSIAATTGVFRIYNRDHWLSDVVAGAGFGILSTKAAYLVYPAIRRWLMHKDEKVGCDDNTTHKSRYQNVMLVPSFSSGTAGLSFSASF
ncbi:MAG TPA: phosphatase PAP2 family protein [Mucilaginibacter sp.]|nr:phosphatase PAP2 family protein [Mucilaginibacter sp.]